MFNANVLRYFIVIMLIFNISGCKKSQEAPKSVTPIKVAFNTWIGYSAFYIAEEKGFLAKRGIKVEAKVIDPLAEKNAAMLRGNLDGMGGTIDSAVISSAGGVNGKVVWMFDRSNGTDGILVAGDIKSPQDLKGKSIAVEEGFVGHFFLLYYLEKNGLKPSDVKIIPMTTDQAGAAFAAGKVDVAVTWEPYLSTAKKRPGARVLVSSKELEPILADTLFMSETFINTRPQDLQALVDALQEANNYWLANPEECNNIVVTRWKMKPQEVKDIMMTDELYDTAHNNKQFGKSEENGDLYNYIDKCAKLWYEAGIIKKQVNAKLLIEPRFVRNLK
jgi:NitT/TauT family transport system substrate-binding protein